MKEPKETRKESKGTRDGDRFLEQTPFCFLPWGCSLFQIRHTHFEFPATFDGKMQKCLFWTGSRQNLNPGPPVCQLGMLPQDQRGFNNSWGLELCFYTYVAGNSNWECPTWNKEHPHGKKQNGVCSRYLSPSLTWSSTKLLYMKRWKTSNVIHVVKLSFWKVIWRSMKILLIKEFDFLAPCVIKHSSAYVDWKGMKELLTS